MAALYWAAFLFMEFKIIGFSVSNSMIVSSTVHLSLDKVAGPQLARNQDVIQLIKRQRVIKSVLEIGSIFTRNKTQKDIAQI